MGTIAKTASQIQKERTQELEQQAVRLLEKCDVVYLASVNETGYPRVCAITKVKADENVQVQVTRPPGLRLRSGVLLLGLRSAGVQ